MDHLLAETGHFENHDHWAIRAGPWKPFNSHFLHQTATNTVGSTHKRHHMVFVEQHGRRRILNVRELTTMAWNIFRANTAVIDPSQTLSTASAHGTKGYLNVFSFVNAFLRSFVNAFLRRGGTAIIQDFWELSANKSTSKYGGF